MHPKLFALHEYFVGGTNGVTAAHNASNLTISF